MAERAHRNALKHDCRDLGIGYAEIEAIPDGKRMSIRKGTATTLAKRVVEDVVLFSRSYEDVGKRYGITRERVRQYVRDIRVIILDRRELLREAGSGNMDRENTSIIAEGLTEDITDE